MIINSLRIILFSPLDRYVRSTSLLGNQRSYREIESCFSYSVWYMVGTLNGQPVGSILRLHAAGYSSALVSRSSLHLLFGRSRYIFCSRINKISPPKCVFYWCKQPPLEGITFRTTFFEESIDARRNSSIPRVRKQFLFWILFLGK